MRGALAGLSLASLAAASPVLVNSIHNDAAPIISASNAKEIADNYMIKFKDHVTQNLAAQHHGWVQDLHEKTQALRPSSVSARRPRWSMTFSAASSTPTISPVGSWATLVTLTKM
jgi:cerevisin